MDVYQQLARTLDSLPNGFPASRNGAEIRLLQKLFSPQDAALTSLLSPGLETAEVIAARIGGEKAEVRARLKDLARRGLINSGKAKGGLGFGLMPFVVGFYETQVATMDKELAGLVEAYFKEAFGEALQVRPQFHRVVPVGESVRGEAEIHPFESATGLVSAAASWGVLDCVCRKQKALIGEGCAHPVDVCMALGESPGAFNNNPVIRALTRDEALATLKRAADAGLVHSVSNNRQGIQYICNCCTCSCGILRGMASLGIANVIARSAFVNVLEATACNGCEACLAWCQFNALSMDGIVRVDENRCIGCGVCVPACPSEALSLVRRPEDQVLPIPETAGDWRSDRLRARGLTPPEAV